MRAAIGEIHPALRRRVRVRPGGCWNWEGPADGAGYAQSSYAPTALPAARLVWAALREPLGPYQTLLTLCHDGTDCPGGPGCLHRRCVNPDHHSTMVAPLEDYGAGPTGPRGL